MSGPGPCTVALNEMDSCSGEVGVEVGEVGGGGGWGGGEYMLSV